MTNEPISVCRFLCFSKSIPDVYSQAPFPCQLPSCNERIDLFLDAGLSSE